MIRVYIEPNRLVEMTEVLEKQFQMRVFRKKLFENGDSGFPINLTQPHHPLP